MDAKQGLRSGSVRSILISVAKIHLKQYPDLAKIDEQHLRQVISEAAQPVSVTDAGLQHHGRTSQ